MLFLYIDVDYSKVITWGSFLSTNYYLVFLFCYILVSLEKYILDYLKMDWLFFSFFFMWVGGKKYFHIRKTATFWEMGVCWAHQVKWIIRTIIFIADYCAHDSFIHRLWNCRGWRWCRIEQWFERWASDFAVCLCWVQLQMGKYVTGVCVGEGDGEGIWLFVFFPQTVTPEMLFQSCCVTAFFTIHISLVLSLCVSLSLPVSCALFQGWGLRHTFHLAYEALILFRAWREKDGRREGERCGGWMGGMRATSLPSLLPEVCTFVSL